MRGQIHGRLVEAGWGSGLGDPGLILDDGAEQIEVWVLESIDLASDGPRLDRFEGPGYRRTEVTVITDHGNVTAFIYVVAES